MIMVIGINSYILMFRGCARLPPPVLECLCLRRIPFYSYSANVLLVQESIFVPSVFSKARCARQIVDFFLKRAAACARGQGEIIHRFSLCIIYNTGYSIYIVYIYLCSLKSAYLPYRVRYAEGLKVTPSVYGR